MKRFFSLALAVILCSGFFGTGTAETVIDFDLSAFNRSITYAQMIQVCNAPEGYDGKVFRLMGKFNYSETTGLAKIIFSDSSGCCELAMIFTPAEPLEYPIDFPPLYSDIMITAKLFIDRSDPEMPCWFVEAELEWQKENTPSP